MKKSLLWSFALCCAVAVTAATPPAKVTGRSAAALAGAMRQFNSSLPGPRVKTPAAGHGTFVTPMKSGASTATRPTLTMTGNPVSILGNFIYSEPVGGVAPHSGIWRFLTNGEMIPEYTTLAPSPYAAFEYDGEYYQYTLGSDGKTPTIFIRNYDTWAFGGFFTLSSIEGLATVADLDPVTQKVYGVCYNSSGDGFRFCRIDFGSGNWTFRPVEIKPLEGPEWHAFCFDSTGQGYAIDYEGNLLKVDKGTGQTETVGNTGIRPAYAGGAQIDPASGRMFWAVCLDDGTSHIYEVNLATAAATHQLQFEHNDQVTGLLIPDSRAANVPAIATNLKAEFAAPSLKGKVSFDIPAFRANGKEAQGDVNYTVRLDITGIYSDYTGRSTYGGHVDIDVEALCSGPYSIIVTLNEDGGAQSDRNVLKTHIGYDMPSAPVVKASWADGKATVSWEPVTTSVNNAYLDPEAITYNVIRYPDQVMVASKTKATTVVDEFTPSASTQSVYYTVRSLQKDATGMAGTSNKIFFGAKSVPYTEGFDYPTALAQYSIIDNGQPSNTWRHSTLGSNGIAAIRWSDPPLDHDDWLITPPIEMYKGRLYTFSFKYRGQTANATFGQEAVEVKLGNAAQASAMQAQLMPATDFCNDTWTEFTKEFSVAEDGVWFIGIHAISPTDMTGFYIDDISITGGTAIAAPGPVTDLKLTPGLNGALTVKGTFKAPETDLDGTPLTALSAIEVTCGNKTVATFANPAPGAALEFTDTPTRDGEYIYTVTPSSAAGKGRAVTAGVYAGVDYAADVENLTLKEVADGTVQLSWDAVTTDVNSGPLDADKVTYDIYTHADGTLVKKGLSATTCEFKAVDDGSQAILRYVVKAVTRRGASKGTASPVIIGGTPYKAPYVESFTDGTAWSPLAVYTYEGSAQWSSYVGDSSDSDNGYAAVRFFEQGTRTMLYTGKIDLSTLAGPYASFYVYRFDGETADNNSVAVKARVAGTEEWTTLATHTAAEITGDHAGWSRTVADLSAFAGKTVQIGIEVTHADFSAAAIDNIRVSDIPATAISAGNLHVAPLVQAGDRVNGFVAVENGGLQDVSSIDATITLDGAPALTLPLGAMRGGDALLVPFEIPTHAGMTGRRSLQAEVSAPAGDDPSDNTTLGATFTVVGSTLPAPEGLEASVDADATVISWNAPGLSDFEPFADPSFESAAPWARGLDGWRFVDRDGKAVGGVSGMSIPGISPGVSRASFFVFDNSSASGSKSLTAYDGHKFLAALYAADDTEVDDWAISPLLTGETQTLTFHARSFSEEFREKIEVLVSMTDSDPSSFTPVLTIESVPCVPDADGVPMWQEYSADLPAGARYFAIRSCAAGGFMLMLDGFDFKAATGADAISLKGYNLYRDTAPANASLLAAESFADTPLAADETRTYAATALYSCGESALSEPLKVSTAGIGATGADSEGVKVTALTGAILVEGAEGREITVATLPGINIRHGAADAATLIPCRQGVYIVSVGTLRFKVAVK